MEIKKGDIILVHSGNITGRLIQFGMNVERWRWFSFKPFWKFISNHAGICIEDGIIAEALAKGITIQPIEKAYGKSKNKTLTIYRPEWNGRELTLLSLKARRYEGVKYQFLNFLQYVPKIFLGVWLGKTHKKAEDKLYCTEYVGLVINQITDGRLFPKYWRSSPSGIQNWCERNCKKVAVYKL